MTDPPSTNPWVQRPLDSTNLDPKTRNFGFYETFFLGFESKVVEFKIVEFKACQNQVLLNTRIIKCEGC